MISEDGETRFPFNGSRILRYNQGPQHGDRLIETDNLNPGALIFPLFQNIVERPTHLKKGFGPWFQEVDHLVVDGLEDVEHPGRPLTPGCNFGAAMWSS
jgi:hypothetical protein